MAALIPPPPNYTEEFNAQWRDWLFYMWQRTKGLEPGSGGPGDGDGNAVHVNVDAEIFTIGGKGVPVDADILLLEDSDDGYSKKQLTMLNLRRLEDNIPWKYGTGDDASILFDSTNLVINPKVVGSGYLDVQGDLGVIGHIAAGAGATISTDAIINAVETFDVTLFNTKTAMELTATLDTTNAFAGLLAASVRAEADNSGGSSFITGLKVETNQINDDTITILTGAEIGVASAIGTTGAIATAIGLGITGFFAGARPTIVTGCLIGDVGSVGVNIATGMTISKQEFATINRGLVLKGDNNGSDILFGIDQDASILYDGTNLVLDPKLVGTGYLDVVGTIKHQGRIENINSTAKTANYSVLITDDNILCDTSGGTFTVTLPASPETGRVYTIILETNGNALTVDGNGKNIVGVATIKLLHAHDAMQLVYNGTQWSLK